MSPQTLLLLPLVLPLVVAVFILPLLRKRSSLAAIATFGAVVLSFAAFLLVMRTPAVTFSAPWFGSFSLSFSLGSWKALLLIFVFVFQLMSVLYLTRYITQIRKPFLFLFFILVAFAAACGVILTDNLLFLLVAWEMFLVALYAVIHSGGPAAEPVALKALIIGGTSDFLMILGLILFFNLAPGQTIAVHLPVDSSFAAFASFFLLFLGAGAKAGMFPFHTWIPDAAEAMPTAGFAALPASLEKIIGIYFLFMVTNQMFVLNETARTIMYLFALATIFAVVFPALVEKNLKRVLALTAIAPVGFMVAGMATSEVAGMAGALMLMLTHATYKSTMFFAAGNFESRAGDAKLISLEGIGRVMPVTTAAFFFAFTAAISLPPTGGFISKELIFEGLMERGHYVVFAGLWIGAILNIAVFCKIMAVLWAKSPEDRPTAEAPLVMALPVILLGLIAIFSGPIFSSCAPIFSEGVGAENPFWILKVWEPSPLMMASFSVYILGAVLFFVARERCARPAETFSALRTSPALGRALEMAEAKKFDAYEIGLKVIHFIAGVVFKYFDRMIDTVTDGLISIGRGVFRPLLSGVHNGFYGNYLGWVIAGLVIVLTLVFFK